MTLDHRESISIFFSVLIIAMATFIVQEFLIPLAWAGIIAMATWPAFKRWSNFLNNRDMLAATTLIIFFTLVLFIPLVWLTYVLSKEAQVVTTFLIKANRSGIVPPHWLQSVPLAGDFLHQQWMQAVGEPHALAKLLSSGAQTSVKPIGDLIKKLGLQIFHRSIIFGFTILCLFFFYKDGRILVKQINAIGKHIMDERWALYFSSLPEAILATVNGLVVVGLGVGLIMGGAYALAGVPAPVIFGGITAVLAMIPFGAPIAFAFVILLLLAKNAIAWAVAIAVIGTVVMFVADHAVRPSLIGSATKLPFLAVLFGILGGVKTLGLVGLFIGPVIMVLFVTLWHEPEVFESQRAVI